MLQSMTGYGRSTTTFNNKKITAEIRSVNSKQLDISTRISPLFREKEIEIRTLIANDIVRGKVDFSLTIEDLSTANAITINSAIAKLYFEQIKALAEECNYPLEPSIWSSIIRMPEVMKPVVEELDNELWESTQQVIQEAINTFVVFRKTEGESLKRVFENNISNISTLLNEIEPFENERVERIKSKLEDNLNQLPIDIDPNRLAQEMIFYIEKLDVNEEKNRLRQHLSYFLQTMNEEETPGKKLGFIAQEIGREINTLGSKSNHGEMQKIVVKMKDELEQIKEQVLNTL